jgi:cell division GTPase FtsZ
MQLIWRPRNCHGNYLIFNVIRADSVVIERIGMGQGTGKTYCPSVENLAKKVVGG